MKIIDPGHLYLLTHLDGPGQTLVRFVKRMGPEYPGNDSHYEGTTTQEVIRMLIDRTKYVNNQHSWDENQEVLASLRTALWTLEKRAAMARGELDSFLDFCVKNQDMNMESLPTCNQCGHVSCRRHNI